MPNFALQIFRANSTPTVSYEDSCPMLDAENVLAVTYRLCDPEQSYLPMAMLQPAIPLPQLHLPHSPHTVTVSIINTTAHLSQIPSCIFVRPAYQGHKLMDIANFAFLIEHNGQKILFDLGVRKDWEANSPPSLVDRMKLGGWKVEVEKNVPDILQDNGISLDAIDAVIWSYVFNRTCQARCADNVASHHHIAHTGDPSGFPSKTSMVVGPGFKRLFTLPTLTRRLLPFSRALALVVQSEKSPLGEDSN